MSDKFEIVVYQYFTRYDCDLVMKEYAIDRFIELCKMYINPHEVDEKYVEIINGVMYIRYMDLSGDDTSKAIEMIGLFTYEMLQECKRRLKELYIGNCQACTARISNKWFLCEDCLKSAK